MERDVEWWHYVLFLVVWIIGNDYMGRGILLKVGKDKYQPIV